MGKQYDEYGKKYLGESDVACLTLTGFTDTDGVTAQILKFGGDGDYNAYVVDEDAVIGEHYTLEAEFQNWVTVYDDTEKMAEFTGDVIRFYRAGNYGIIVQVIGGSEK